MRCTTTRKLLPDERVLCRTFRADGCLYRDSQGRRVLADVEGAGWVWVEGAADLVILSDGLARPEHSLHFRHSVRVVAEGSGLATVHLRIGDGPPPIEPQELDLPYSGCGWYVESSQAAIADDWDEPLLPGAPFYRRITGTQRARIVPAGKPWVRVDAELSQSGLSRPHPENGCRSVLNRLAIRFRVENPGGVRLVRSYDRFHGRQRARVVVNGEPVGWWRDDVEDRTARIGRSAFGFSGPSGSHVVEILPQPGSALWSFGEIEVLAENG